MTAALKRRWLQFSTRTLLLLMFAAACYFAGWATSEWRRRAAMEHSSQAVQQGAVAQSEGELAAALERLQFTRRLHAKGFAGPSQVQADQWKVDAARLRLEQAKSASPPQ